MTVHASPALETFLLQVGSGLVLGQVLLRPSPAGFELRHETDRDRAPGALRSVPLAELRTIAQSTDEKSFRPLKSAPNLRAGWIHLAAEPAALEAALNILYPGAVADWFAVRTNTAAPTDYREFTGRQTGMYRLTALLADAQAAAMIRACCDRRFCLKQRLWTVAGLPPDRAGEKSLIPCLEPCALLMEFARKAARFEQDDRAELPGLSADERETIESALQQALQAPPGGGREADFGAALNPRRVQLLLEKFRAGKAAGKPEAS